MNGRGARDESGITRDSTVGVAGNSASKVWSGDVYATPRPATNALVPGGSESACIRCSTATQPNAMAITHMIAITEREDFRGGGAITGAGAFQSAYSIAGRGGALLVTAKGGGGGSKAAGGGGAPGITAGGGGDTGGTAAAGSGAPQCLQASPSPNTRYPQSGHFRIRRYRNPA